MAELVRIKRHIVKICRNSSTEVQNLKYKSENPRLHFLLIIKTRMLESESESGGLSLL